MPVEYACEIKRNMRGILATDARIVFVNTIACPAVYIIH